MPEGYCLHRFNRLASTNDEAKERAKAGAADRTVILGAQQGSGRGRYGRVWSSPPGNLYVSFIFRPSVPVSEAAQIGYVASIAVVDTLSGLLAGAAGVSCKWPNDVLVDGKKIAGILPESSIGIDGALEWIVLGIGINIAHHPRDSRWPSTCLADHGVSVTVDALLGMLAGSLDKSMVHWQEAGFTGIRQAWVDRAWAIGQDIRVEIPERVLAGRFAGLDDAGSMILEGPDGHIQKIHYGEVFPVEGL